MHFQYILVTMFLTYFMNNDRKNNATLTQFFKTRPNLISVLKPGDLAEAVYLEKGHKAAYFDLGTFGTGMVYGTELMNAQNILKNLKIGDKITAKVLDIENDAGYVELSLAGAEKQKTWQALKDFQERGEIIPVKISGANSGGLLTKVNEVNGFIPISQLVGDHSPRIEDGDKTKIIEALQKLIGQELKVKIIDLNPRSNKLILSEREVAGENVKELLAKYKAGDLVEGIVSGIADFGVFIKFADNPKIEGMIHISELDYRILESPKEVVKLNDAVKAKIIEIKDGRVSLSLKALKEDPWLKAEEMYKAGQEVSGIVSHFNPFGAFVNLDYGLQGLVHVSEFGGVPEMKKQLEQGKSYDFTIEAMKSQEKRIILKLKK